jgi:hypothetical protein
MIKGCFVKYGQDLEIFEKPSRIGQAGLETGYKLRFLHIGNHQPVFGPGDGHVEESYQPVSGLVRGDDPVRADQANQVEVQAFGAGTLQLEKSRRSQIRGVRGEAV